MIVGRSLTAYCVATLDDDLTVVRTWWADTDPRGPFPTHTQHTHNQED